MKRMPTRLTRPTTLCACAMIDEAGFLAEAQLGGGRGFAKRHQAAMREAHFIGRQRSVG